MKHKLFIIAAFALLLASCAKNEIVEPQPRVMHLTATVEEPADTRATLEELGTGELKAIRFKWEAGDIIQMAFVQGITQKTANATVTAVSNEGRTAQFSVTVPTEITASNFTLYAYRSSRFSHITEGSELLATNPIIAVLPKSSHEYHVAFSKQKYLVSMWDKKDVAYTGGAMPAVSLSFKHLGAMLTIKINNTTGAEIGDLHTLTFESTTKENWVRNAVANGMAQFNMETGSYQAEDMAHYSLSALINTGGYGKIKPGVNNSYFLWFVPAAYTTGNAIKLVAWNTAWAAIGSSGANTKNAANFQPGKNYVVYVKISGTNPNYVLQYSNAAWE